MEPYISAFSKLISGSLFLILYSCSQPKSTFTLTNNSNLARTDEPLTLSRESILEKAGHIPDDKSPLITSAKGDTISSQLDDLNNDGTWDELAFLANIPADTSLIYSITFVDSTNYPKFKMRTNIRFGVMDSSGIRNRKKLMLKHNDLPIPAYTMFQMDGPVWENDKVGFRHYILGQNQRDLYGKISHKMVLDTVGISAKNKLVNNYQVMKYWGQDILSVGNSLGIGGLGMMNNGIPVRLGVRTEAPRNDVDTTTYQLISEGPVRSIFKLTYRGWHVSSKKVDIKDQVSIWGGHYWYKSKVTVLNSSQKDTLVVGLVNSNNDKPLMVLDRTASKWIGLVTHDKQTSNKKWYLGLGLLLPQKQYLGYNIAPKNGQDIKNSYNALLITNNENPLEYYALAGWEMSDKRFAERIFFKEFIENEIAKIQHPVDME